MLSDTLTDVSHVSPVLLKDGYKVGHVFQYPADTEMVYSNFTARKGRDDDWDGIVFFGLQYFIQEYLLHQFDQNFFARDKDEVIAEYDRRMGNYLGPINSDHIAALHDLQYLPLHIKALPEGSFVPYGVPVLTVRNTLPEFYWLTNMIETLMSNVLWMGSTSATTAFRFQQVFRKYAKLTVGEDLSFVPWQGHDFSFRGLPGVEAAMISGGAHLLSFTGTDTIPAIDFLEMFYGADSDKELVGGSVPATEHSVMCMGSAEHEQDTFERLITEVYPSGIVSVVSDTWDLWKVLGEYLPNLKDKVLAREGKLVIRPDSGDPVDIVCGDPNAPEGSPEHKGAIEMLWDTFGGTITDKGFKLLDSHVGLIYGDGINLKRQEDMLRGLYRKGFASYNVVMGIGSFSYQGVTRDTHGFAMKATAGATTSGGFQEIFKDPKTDNGAGKKSARGLLRVDKIDGKYTLTDQVTAEEEQDGELKTVFLDGGPATGYVEQPGFQTLAEIRKVVESNDRT